LILNQYAAVFCFLPSPARQNPVPYFMPPPIPSQMEDWNLHTLNEGLAGYEGDPIWQNFAK
jgi:hypothetical protein